MMYKKISSTRQQKRKRRRMKENIQRHKKALVLYIKIKINILNIFLWNFMGIQLNLM